jgi:hypothetical protein
VISRRQRHSNLWLRIRGTPRGALRNLRRWQELGSQLASGILSNEEFVHDFQGEVLPFWQNADKRLTRELRTMPADMRSFGRMFLVVIHARKKLAHTVVAVVSTNDTDAATKIQAANAETDRADARVTRIMLLSDADHRLRSLRDSFLVRQLRFRLQSGSCAHGVSSADNMVSPTDSASDGPSLRSALGCTAQRLFLSGDYHTLSSRLQEYGHSMQDLPDGTAQFSGMMDGLDDLFEFGGLSVTEALNRVSDWRQSDRASPYPGFDRSHDFPQVGLWGTWLRVCQCRQSTGDGAFSVPAEHGHGLSGRLPGRQPCYTIVL